MQFGWIWKHSCRLAFSPLLISTTWDGRLLRLLDRTTGSFYLWLGEVADDSALKVQLDGPDHVVHGHEVQATWQVVCYDSSGRTRFRMGWERFAGFPDEAPGGITQMHHLRAKLVQFIPVVS